MIDAISGMDSRISISDKVHVEAKKDVKQETKLVGRIKKIPGLILYSFSFETSELKEVPIQRNKVLNIDDGKPIEHDKAFYDPECIYIQCLNLKAAVNKINKFVYKRLNVQNYLIINDKKPIINPIYVTTTEE